MPSTRTKPGRSRLPSPTQLSSSPTGHNRGMATGSEGSRNFMQRWLEPPVQNKASYQEAGLVKGGVVENMAPLGTLPKAAMAKKPTQPGESANLAATTTTAGTPSIKRIVLKKPLSSAPAVVASSTPSETPPGSVADGDRHIVLEKPISSALTALVSPSDTELTAVAEGDTPSLIADTLDDPMSPLSREPLMDIAMDDAEDDDYVPQPRSKLRNQSSQKKSSARVNGRRSTPARSESARRQSRQAAKQQSRQASPSPSPETASSPALGSAPGLDLESQEKEFVDKVVETAVQEALNHNRYPTAFALRQLYDDNAGDTRFTSMIEDIYHQRADMDTMHDFKNMVKQKKKDGAKGNKGFSYFLPGTESPEKPRPAPYSDLIAKDVGGLDEAQSGQVTPCERASKKQRLDSNGRAAHRAATGTPSRSAGGKNGGKKVSPTKRRRQRAGSASSTSSLSSAPDDMPEDFDEYMDQVDDDLGVSRPSGGGAAEPSNNALTPASPPRPISTTQPKLATKKKPAQPSPAPTVSLPQNINKKSRTSHNSANQSHGSRMPALVIPDGASKSTTTTIASVNPKKATGGKLATLDPKVKDFLEKKRGAKAVNANLTDSATLESFTRDSLAADETPLATPRASVPRSEPPRPLLKTPTPASMGRTTRAAKRTHDEIDDVISPTSLSLRPNLPEPPSTRGSRAATPSNLRSSTANKKARAGVRVKTSPMKKKGLSAGIRGPGDRLSPAGNAAPGNKDDNDDFCYTCSGSGDLVCCDGDGCTYSFHTMCIDPAITEDDICRNDSWYCNECLARRKLPSGEGKGPFGPLLQKLESKNPLCFGLPTSVRDIFEGVKTGPDGEYEDFTAPVQKPKPGKRGVEEAFDFHRIRNPDETAALCHECNRGSLDDRVLLPCSVCGLNWHLECLDPPLAVPPPPRTWVCPAHVDDMCIGLIRKLAPAHKPRNIKNSAIIEQAYSRGLKNNGNIIVEEDSDEEVPVRDFGRVYRVSEKGIKLDFLAKVRREREERAKHAAVATITPPAAVPKSHTLEEQQVALNLTQLTQGDGDNTQLLVNALLAEASPGILQFMAAGDSGRIGGGNFLAQDNTALQAMKIEAEKLVKNISKILEARGEPTSQESIPTVATPASLVEKQAPGSDAGLNDNFALDDKEAGAEAPAKDAMQMD